MPVSQASRWPTMVEQRDVFNLGRADGYAGISRDPTPFMAKYFQAYAYLCGRNAGMADREFEEKLARIKREEVERHIREAEAAAIYQD